MAPLLWGELVKCKRYGCPGVAVHPDVTGDFCSSMCKVTYRSRAKLNAIAEMAERRGQSLDDADRLSDSLTVLEDTLSEYRGLLDDVQREYKASLNVVE